MIPALITFIITVLVFLCGFLAYQLHLSRKEEMSQMKQVQELANHLRIGRWVVRNVHHDNLDELIADHTPPPEGQRMPS